jgi:NADH-quinone oxidoreductase subunit N
MLNRERIVSEAVAQILGTVKYIVPETILILAVCVNFLAGPFLVSEKGEAPAGLRHKWGWLALIAIALSGLAWWNQSAEPLNYPNGPFQLDSLALFVRGLSLAAAAILVLIGWNQIDDAHAAEFHACLLLISAGVTLTAAANDIIALFLALELVSIPTYVLIYLPRRDAAAQEATLKYFLLSVFSSAILLYGMSFLFGVTGTTNLTAIQAAITTGAGGAMPAVLLLAIVAVVAGLCFRLTAVPFHFYAPDVFQGAPTTGAAMLAFVPKIAGFVALLRLIAFPVDVSRNSNWSLVGMALPLLTVVAIASMLVGNLVALLQTNVKRMLAWSSISHAGYMLVGIVAGPTTTGTVNGTDALLFYLVAYGAMTIGVFAALSALGRSGRSYETLDDLAGLSQSHPAIALLMTVFLFSLTGLPPTAGFLGKLNLFLAAWSGSSVSKTLAIVLAINAGIAAWYYLKVVATMYLHPLRRPTEGKVELPALIGLAICAAATLGFFALPNLLWTIIRGS